MKQCTVEPQHQKTDKKIVNNSKNKINKQINNIRKLDQSQTP